MEKACVGCSDCTATHVHVLVFNYGHLYRERNVVVIHLWVTLRMDPRFYADVVDFLHQLGFSSYKRSMESASFERTIHHTVETIQAELALKESVYKRGGGQSTTSFQSEAKKSLMMLS